MTVEYSSLHLSILIICVIQKNLPFTLLSSTLRIYKHQQRVGVWNGYNLKENKMNMIYWIIQFI